MFEDMMQDLCELDTSNLSLKITDTNETFDTAFFLVICI